MTSASFISPFTLRTTLTTAFSGISALLSPVVLAAGLMTPTAGHLPNLTIKEHHVAVTIEDGYAITTIDQTFINPHLQSLEANYSFPIPDKAAIGEFTYWIDGKAVTGEVVEKQKARAIYEHEKGQGNPVALTEQDAYRTFDSKVYPVLPQSDVRIRLKYFQPVHVDLGMGRYVYPLEEGGVDDQKLAFWRYDDTVKEAFSFKLSMRSSYPIEQFRLPHHPQAVINQGSAHEWQVTFGNTASAHHSATSQGAAGEDPLLPATPSTPAVSELEAPLSARHNPPSTAAHRLDKDIVVYWRHQPDLPGSVDMVTYREPGSERGTFMLTLTPGDDLSTIQAGRDWIFVLDISGSMQGKYTSLVEGVSQALHKLNAKDRFRVVLFNNQARELTPGYINVTPETINTYSQMLANTTPQGGTNLYAGLEKGFQALDADRPSAILLVTDGVANVGTTAKKAFLKLLEQRDVRLFSFVMGNSANRPLLEGMSNISNGFAMSISNSDDIVGRILQTADKLTHEALRDINIDINGTGVKVEDITPAHVGSLYNGQQLMVFGHYRGDGNAQLIINGKTSNENKQYQSALNFPAVSGLNPEIERLWAYASIEGLQARMDFLGQDNEGEQAIIDLAVQYGLVTDYTSLIVVRDTQFEQHKIDRNNQQRVAKEATAQQSRQAQPVQEHRQDTHNPTYDSPRPRVGGGSGALGPWTLILLLPLLMFCTRRGCRQHSTPKR